MELRCVVGYEEHYKISDSGILFSTKFNKNLQLKARIKRGYVQYVLYINDIPKHISAHRLVAQAFLPNWDASLQVNHKNGIKTDNRVSNLEMVTSRENVVHAYKSGLSRAARGAFHGNTRLSETDVRAIRDLYETKNYTQRSLAEKYMLGQSTVSAIIRRVNWAHCD